jgi:hypothetical protein
MQGVESKDCEHSRYGHDMQYWREGCILGLMARVPERITHAPQSCLTGWVDGRCRLVLGSRSTRPPLSTKLASTSPQGWRGRRAAKQCDLPRKLCSATSVTTFTTVHERGLGGSRHGDEESCELVPRSRVRANSPNLSHALRAPQPSHLRTTRTCSDLAAGDDTEANRTR